MNKYIFGGYSKRSEKLNTKVRKRRRIFILTILMCAIILNSIIFKKQIVVFMFEAFYSNEIKNTLDKSYKPINAGNESESENEQIDPFSVLLIGTDQRDQEPARSDSLIYTVIRPKGNRILLISIPRDSYAYIVGYDKKSKINAAYAYGGTKMSIDTIENLFEQPVNYYASINFKGLVDIVNTLGGVKLPIEIDIVNKQENHDKFTIKANKPIYNGVEALNYVRYREDSDFERTARQRIFIGSMFDRMKKFGNITKIDDAIRIGGNNINTNMRSEMVLGLARSVIKEIPEISNYMLKGEDAKIDGIYYYLLHEDDLKNVNEIIEKWLSPETIDFELDIPSESNK
jgi:LCP family protein required for cell wall assembly